MILCVCGGRDYADKARVFWELDLIHAQDPIQLLVQGAQRAFDKDLGRYVGADWFGVLWARENRVTMKPYPADWKRQGHAAGPIRNRTMADQSGMDVCLAFPRRNGAWGSGTLDMIQNAQRVGAMVLRIEGEKG